MTMMGVVKDDGVEITGLEILQQPASSYQEQQPSAPTPQATSKPKGTAALSPIRQPKGKLQRKKKMPPNRAKSCPKQFSMEDQPNEKAAKKDTPTQQQQQNTRQTIQQQPLARVTRRSSMGSGLGYSAAQPVVHQHQQPVQQQQQQRPLARVPRRSSMGAAPGYNPGGGPVQVQPSAKQQQQQLQQQQQQRYGQMRRNSVGGAQALPRVSRRVSIGNQDVGVEQVRWGQKPQRRSSVNNTSNYEYAPSAPVQPPQSQIHLVDGLIDVSNNSTLSHSSYHGNDSFNDFSRRSSLSSHGSDFVENSRGIFHKNDALGYGEDNDNDSFASSCFSYANDSVDLRGQKGKNKMMESKQQQTSRQQPRRRFDDDNDEDSFSSCGSTFADSLDLRRGRDKQTRRTSNDSLESSCGSTYAADSIDLRRNSKLKQKAAVTNVDLGYGDADDLGYGDARPSSAAIDNDLGYGDARPSSGMVVNEDSFTSGCYSYANDSFDMRQLHTKAATGRSALTDEDLGYGDVLPNSAQIPDLGYGDTPRRIVPDDDDADSFTSSCYSYACDSIDMRQVRKKHMAAADDADLGYEDAMPSSAQAIDLGYEDARPASSLAIDLGYEDAPPSNTQAVDLGYGDAPPSRQEYIDDDDDADLEDSGAESSFGSASYSYAADSVAIRSKRRTATTTNMEDDEDEQDDDEDEDDEDEDSASTPMDYMTRVVMGYCNDTQEGARRGSLESVGTDSCYSYACNSVDLRPKKRIPQAATSKRQGYDDDSEDYSDDDSSVGNNAYLSGGVLGRGGGKPQGRVASEVERRLSCNSLANDSVDLRKFGKKKPAGGIRRTSIDSLNSDVSMFSGGDLDPDYLHSVLGYAMEASSSSIAIPNNVITGSDADIKETSKHLSKSSMGSITSRPSCDSDDDLSEEDDPIEEAPIVAKKSSKVPRLGRKLKPIERCHSQPMLGRHNRLSESSNDDDDSFTDDYKAESSDDEFKIPKKHEQTRVGVLTNPGNDPVRISVLSPEQTASFVADLVCDTK